LRFETQPFNQNDVDGKANRCDSIDIICSDEAARVKIPKFHLRKFLQTGVKWFIDNVSQLHKFISLRSINFTFSKTLSRVAYIPLKINSYIFSYIS